MDAWIQVVLAVLALGTPLSAYLIAVRKASGRIGSSDATELWAEAAAIRREHVERIRVLEARLAFEEERIVRLVEENNRLIRAAAGDGHA
jgi:hypothetical protein